MDFEKLHTYSEEHTSAESALLKHIVRQTHLKTLAPRMLSGHLQGRFLSLLSKMMQPKRILEVGSFTGYAALCLAEGLAPDGILYALEGNDELENMLKTHFEASEYASKIQLIIGDARKVIPTLDEVFDIVFIDAGKRDYPEYFDIVIEKVRSGGLIIADNVLWSGKILDEKKDKDTTILDTFNKKVRDDDRVENLLLPLRDGLMIAMKK